MESNISNSAVPAAAEPRKPTELLPLATLCLTTTWLKFEAFTPKVFNSNREFSMLTNVVATDNTLTPLPPLLITVVLSMNTFPPAVAMSIPLPVKPKISQFSMARDLPASQRIPLIPVPIPLMRRFLRITTSDGPAWTTMPLVPLTRTEATCPPPPSMVMALVMVSAPNPAGSRASISPPGAVLEIAPANVLHGAVRLQGLASSPTPDTQVREAWAPARPAHNRTTARIFNVRMCVFPFQSLIGALSVERGLVRAGRGFACVLVLEVKGSYQKSAAWNPDLRVNLA